MRTLVFAVHLTTLPVHPPESSRWLRIFLLLTAGAMGVYIALRAWLVPPYCDEVWTYFLYQQTGSFQPGYAHLDANNHVLNSLSGHLSFLLFGGKLFALRLPNVLAFALFVFSAWKLQRFFRQKAVWACFFLALICGEYLTSFFSLNRGYGLSVAFMMSALYFTFVAFAERKRTGALAACAMLSLAVWANLSLLAPALLHGGIITVWMVLQWKRPLKPSWIGADVLFITGLFVVPFYFAVQYALLLKENNALYHGGNYIYKALYEGLSIEFFTDMRTGQVIFGVMLVLYAGLFTYAIYQKRFTEPSFFLHLLFAGSLAAAVAMHHLLGVPYPMDRAALHFFLFLMAGLFFLLDHVPLKFAAAGMAAVPAAALIVHLLLHLNLKMTRHWKDEMVPESFYTYMENWSQRKGRLPTLSAHGLQGSVFSWHDYQHGGKLATSEDFSFPNTAADFIIVNQEQDTMKFPLPPYNKVLVDLQTGVSLLEKLKPAVWTSAGEQQFADAEGEFEFFAGVEQSVVNLRGYHAGLDIRFDAEAEAFPFHWNLIVEVKDAGGQILKYHTYDLQRPYGDLRKGREIHRRFVFSRIPEQAEKIVVYIWNVHKKKLKVKAHQAEFFRVDE